MSSFEGKICLVTGASRGIGHAIATKLKERGATVLCAQRQQVEGFQSYLCDLCDTQAIEGLVERLIADYGRLDVLVNNAGMMQEAPLEDMSLSLWQETIALNLTTPFWLMAKSLPHLAKTKGAIVNIGSIEGLGANPNHSAYVALNEAFIDAMPDPDAFRRDIGNIHPVGHPGTPQDVAALVAFLASDEARFITGQVMVVDGGRLVQLPLP